MSILNDFPKIYERYLLNCLSGFVDKILSDFIVAHRETNSSNYLLMKLIENWKKQLQ